MEEGLEAESTASVLTGIAELSRRLEVAENQLKQLIPVAPQQQPRVDRPDHEPSKDVAVVSPLLQLGLPSYIAASLSQAEDAVLRRDVALHAGDDDAARILDELTAGLACVALTRAADDFEMPSEMRIEPKYNTFLRAPKTVPGFDMDVERFRLMEVHLLRLIGLTSELASRHVESAFDAFRRSDVLIESEQDIRKALRAAAESACYTHKTIVDARRLGESARLRRRRLRRILVALGGAAIAVTNPLAIPLVGPVAVGVSVVLGSGAAGSAAGVFED